MFLPAHDPYDRQMLLEHIVARTHAERRVRLRVDDLRWMVRLRQGPANAPCSACHCVLNSTCYSTNEHGAAHCLGCAMGNQPGTGPALASQAAGTRDENS